MPKKSPPRRVVAVDDKTATTGDDVIQRVIDAAAICVDRIGLDATTVDDIAREASVSRATLYRRFGNREEILAELLRQQARPYVESSITMMFEPVTLGRRIEVSTMYAVMEMPRNRWLKAMFESGIQRSNFALIRSVYQQFSTVTLLPALDAARQSGELRVGLELQEISDWLLREFILLVSDGPWQEEKLLRRIRRFILPVLIVEVPAPVTPKALARDVESTETRMARLEQRMIEMQQMLALIRSDLHPAGRSGGT
ncbi:MAG: helix-turn-helix domain-containing protein [Spongiibacteraceae bacterium]